MDVINQFCLLFMVASLYELEAFDSTINNWLFERASRQINDLRLDFDFLQLADLIILFS